MSVDSPLSHVKNTLYAMVTTMLAAGTRNFLTDFPAVPKDPTTGHRYVTLEGAKIYIANRARNDEFVSPGVNLYFGDPVALKRKDKPQRWFLQTFIHILVPYTQEHRVGEAQSERFSRAIMDAFDGIGGQQQMWDFYDSPAVPLTGRFVSWAREYRGTWQQLGSPTTDAYTNLQWMFQVRYVD